VVADTEMHRASRIATGQSLPRCLDGPGHPGNTVELRYQFALDGGQISELVIAP
jgi:hypothetical protein